MKQMLLKTFIMCFALLGCVKVFASSSALEFTHNPKAAIKAKISETAPTRISFGKYQITEVIGDESKYKIIEGGNGFNIFITPTVPSGNVIPLTLVARSNKVQDLLLEVSKSEKLPRSLIITPCSNTQDKPLPVKSETALMLKAMFDDENPNDKYYVTHSKRTVTIPSHPKLSLIQDKTWRFKNLTGARLIITNKGFKHSRIYLKDIASLFKGTKLTVLNENLLKKGESTKAFVIIEEEE